MPSPPRTRRRFVPTRKFRAESGEMTGWAVSYSDLLMVLLAFFILYFRFGDQESASILHSVVRDLDSSGQTKGGVPGGGLAKLASGQGERNSAGNLKGVLEQSGFAIEQSALNDSLIVHFPDGFFRPGQYQVGPMQQKRLIKLLNVLEPHRDALDLVFIGHTDSAAIAPGKGKFVDSNLVLSNLRAARAAEFALLKGFDPRHVSSEGVGEFRRSMRSISLKVVERKAP